MPSFLKFYLDLEANGEIIVPQYTTLSTTTHIRIISDIEIAHIYSLKLVDSLGLEHTFLPVYPNSAEYDLETILRDFPLGKVTVHASILDVVGNQAVLTPKTFEIFKSNTLFINLSDSVEFGITSSDLSICKLELLDSESLRISLSDESICKLELLNSEPFGISLSDKGDT